MNKRFLAATIILVLVCPIISHAQKSLICIKTDAPPVVDGAIDALWQTAPEIGTVDTTDKTDPVNIRLKSVHTAGKIYILAVFPDPDESRRHKFWIWDAQKKQYFIGPEREDRFVIKWNIGDNLSTNLGVDADNPYSADIWYWKAHRTDPKGFADDKIQTYSLIPGKKKKQVISKTGKKWFLNRRGDQGSAAYKTRLFFDYQGDQINQYDYRQATGSRGDIRAKGRWKDGSWTIEFERNLDTGHEDDVKFSIDQKFLFGVSVYEIAGREPDLNIDIPLFGCGKISEPLILEFRP